MLKINQANPNNQGKEGQGGTLFPGNGDSGPCLGSGGEPKESRETHKNRQTLGLEDGAQNRTLSVSFEKKMVMFRPNPGGPPLANLGLILSGASFRRGDVASREPEFGAEFWDVNSRAPNLGAEFWGRIFWLYVFQ